MSGRTGAFVGALALLGLTSSGCLSLGGSSLEASTPPYWEAGYTWTYLQEVSYGLAESDAEGASEFSSSYSYGSSSEITYRVFNTTQPLLGEAVYYIEINADGEEDFLFFGGAAQAVTKDGLEIAGTVHNWHVGDENAADDCRYPMFIVPVPADERMPVLRFPLREGERWTGEASFDEPEDIRYTATVEGIDEIETAAGSFDAVHVRILFQMDPATDDDGLADLSMSIENWYSPEVRNLVRSETTVRGTEVDEDTRYVFEARQTSDLASFRLEGEPEESADFELYQELSHAKPYPLVGIVTDRDFPVALQDGPVNATFGVVEAGRAGYESQWNDRVPRVGEIPTSSPFGEEYAIRWTITEPAGPSIVSEGNTTGYEILQGGRYTVEVEVVERDCGERVTVRALGTFSTYWHGSFDARASPGTGGAVVAGEFPVDQEWAWVTVSWRMVPTLTIPTEGGNPVLVDASGDRQPILAPSDGYLVTGAPGEWRIEWDPSGATAGQNADIELRIDYAEPL